MEQFFVVNEPHSEIYMEKTMKFITPIYQLNIYMLFTACRINSKIGSSIVLFLVQLF